MSAYLTGAGRLRKAKKSSQVREGVQEISVACKQNTEAMAGWEKKIYVKEVCEGTLGRCGGYLSRFPRTLAARQSHLHHSVGHKSPLAVSV